jgi:poly(3-hydroxyalkanoate) synthetase
MSWQHGQTFGRINGQLGGKPLAAMTAQVMAATQKPFWEQMVKSIQDSFAKIPDDINWMSFQQGILRYTSGSKPEARKDYPVLWSSGRVSLLDAGGEGAPVVLVPSMINRGYVLDLHPGHSLVEDLRGRGLHVLLVDWGDPGTSDDAPLTLETAIVGRLEPLLEAAVAEFGPLAMLGYCMGGLLALAAAVRLGESKIAKLAVAAMPWDFSQSAFSQHMALTQGMIEPFITGQKVLPPDVMAQYFWLLDPWGPVRRVMAYGAETDPERLAFMTALEDWLADGLPLDAPIAKEMMFDWHADNKPFKGEWVVGGVAINPANLTVPFWVCLTQRDVLVPLASSLGVVGQANNVQVLKADTGHVGLVCGRNAKKAFYNPLGAWLLAPL